VAGWHLIEIVIEEIKAEHARAGKLFPKFNSKHEGLAVLREEYRELEDAIFWGKGNEWETEAVQLAAMALRLVTDCSDRRIGNIPKEGITKATPPAQLSPRL